MRGVVVVHAQIDALLALAATDRYTHGYSRLCTPVVNKAQMAWLWLFGVFSNLA
jgi:hypothetical protein